MGKSLNQIMASIQEHKLSLDVSRDESLQEVLNLNRDERANQIKIHEFASRMKQFIDEVAKNASEKLKLHSEERRIILHKTQEKIKTHRSRLDYMSGFVQNVQEQQFSAAIHRLHPFIATAIKNQDPHNSYHSERKKMAIENFFDGKLIVDNFFTFLRTCAENDELIRSFRHHVYQRGNVGRQHVSPEKTLLLSSPFMSPAAASTTSGFSPPQPKATNYVAPISKGHPLPNSFPVIRPTTDPMKISISVRPLEKQSSMERPASHNNNHHHDQTAQSCSSFRGSCRFCMGPSGPLSKCTLCGFEYHDECHIPVIKRRKDDFKCIMCMSMKQKTRLSEEMNDVRQLVGNLKEFRVVNPLFADRSAREFLHVWS